MFRYSDGGSAGMSGQAKGRLVNEELTGPQTAQEVNAQVRWMACEWYRVRWLTIRFGRVTKTLGQAAVRP
jgi:hypothetical protein